MNLSNLMQKAMAALTIDPAVKQTNGNPAAFMMAFAIGVLALAPELAMAAPWDGAADKVLEIFTGGLTRTLAIICVIACGIAAMAGKLSWDWAIKIIVGITLIFGAAAIVDYVIDAAGS